MTERIKQGAATMERQGDTVKVDLDTFALSIAASRRQGENLIVDHEAVITPSHIETEEQAHEYGLTEAREKWPASEGWNHDVKVVRRTLTFNFKVKA
jgi:hypothetical protein